MGIEYLLGVREMTTASSSFAMLVRCAVLMVSCLNLPAGAMDVELVFHLPRGMGQVPGKFSGFDVNRDGFISSADNEVISAWSPITGSWQNKSFVNQANASSGTVDIKYAYGLDVQRSASGYPVDGYLGLARFAIETKSLNDNHVNSNGLNFSGESRFGFFSAYAISWSDVYNAPSSYTTTFQGPENMVELTLSASGSAFMPAVPEPTTASLVVSGMLAVFLYRRSRKMVSSKSRLIQ